MSLPAPVAFTAHRRRPTAAHVAARGLSLVELMIGIVVGLFVVAAAAMVTSMQLGENRRLLLETQMQQDLRAAADIISRELRRIGTMQNALDAIASPTSAAQSNPFSATTQAGTDPADITYSYFRRPGEQGPWRFVLSGGVIRSRVGPTLQDLTDGNVMTVTRFAITPTTATSIRLPCPKLCPPDAANPNPHDQCWPEVRVREYEIVIEAQARGDATVQRTLRSVVRPRNDWVAFNIAGPPARACPA
ncbi:MAG: hypothetical protein MUF53_12205 [Gemmatimonadaceae bacterium]|jgi:type IV pilus assembly protein PilW|nr:hypothetical protein [Gemmatimonadaceae bacterium]